MYGEEKKLILSWLFVDFFVNFLLTFCWHFVDILLTFCWLFVDLLRWDCSVSLRLSSFLIQNQTFRFSYPRSDFPVFLSKIRLSGFLIPDQSFRFSYSRWDFPVFLSKMRLSGFLIQDKNLTECMADIFWIFCGHLRTFGDIWGSFGDI